ncbi:MAG: DUF4864 domain-containing protein [Alphaproteobacteria bacterium]|jgi:hypothetical protein|nr:DUF4864 domain-containing protein [Alphaproteobacteria bacterium]
MRSLALAVLLTVAGVAPAAALDLAPAERSAIGAVVQAQLDAFRRDAATEAFGHASPGIRRMFETPERFMAMVERGYAPVYRPRRVEFRNVVRYRGRITQRVYVVGSDGEPVIANYLMERQDDGSWRIDGCVLEEVPDIGV